MPVIGLNVMATGITNQTVKNLNGKSTLEFYLEERLGEREPRDFWLEVRHDPNNTYLANKTNAINQSSIKSTTAVLVGSISYEPPEPNSTTTEEATSGKHILKLEDISLITTTSQNRSNPQSFNLPWMSPQTTPTRNSNRTNRSTRNTTPRTPRRTRTTLAQMDSPISPQNQNLTAALEANTIPSMNPSSEPQNS